MVAPSFDIYRWTVASRELNQRYKILEMVQVAIERIKDQMANKFGDADGKHSSVITAENFADLLGAECPNLSESDKQYLCLYAIKGSRRIHGGEQVASGRIDMRNDLI